MVVLVIVPVLGRQLHAHERGPLLLGPRHAREFRGASAGVDAAQERLVVSRARSPPDGPAGSKRNRHRFAAGMPTAAHSRNRTLFQALTERGDERELFGGSRLLD